MEDLIDQQLHQEDMEDRSRRNNLRLRGPPEVTGAEDLTDTALAIFCSIDGVELPERVTLDRIHRALGPRRSDPARPRDVIFRLHYYTHKEQIIRKAWESGKRSSMESLSKYSRISHAPHYTVEPYLNPCWISPDAKMPHTDGDTHFL